jgi:hypothetical protein
MEITLPFSYMVGWLNATSFQLTLHNMCMRPHKRKSKDKKAFSSKGNCSTTSNLKQMSQFEGGLKFSDNEDYIVLEGPWKLSVFLPNQVAIMKELLEKVNISKQSTRPIRSTL